MTTTARYLQIATAIEDQIRSGDLQEGAPLPSINSYAAQENVNRNTVIRAYEKLCDMGLIAPQPGKGYYVAALTTPNKPESSDLRVFWSYSHKDDERTNGAITTLRQRIQDEYELQTGYEASIFQDTKDIEWGMDWRKEINASLGVTRFFIPVITPTYLRSPNCLAELRTAKARFEDLGFEDGIYPIEFINCQIAIEQLNDDSLATLLSDRQRDRRWINLRFEDPQSREYSKAVQDIVQTMIRKESLWHERVEPSATKQEEEVEDVEGYFEKIDGFSESINTITKLIEAINDDTAEIGGVFTNFEMPSNPTPKIIIAQTAMLAQELDEPISSLENHCKQYSTQMNTTSKGIDGVIGFYQILNTTTSTPDTSKLTELYDQIAGLCDTMETPLGQIESAQETVRAFSKFSKAIRQPCKRIDAALSSFVSSTRVIEVWKQKLGEALEEMS